MLSDEQVTEAIAGVIADEAGDRLFHAGPDSDLPDLPEADRTQTWTDRPGLPRNVAVISLTDGREVWVTATIGPPEGSPS